MSDEPSGSESTEAPEPSGDGASSPGALRGWHIYVGGIAFVIGGVLLLYYVFPGAALDWGVNYVRGQAKLERKEVQVGDHTIPYLEGGSGPPVLLLHSLGGSKDDWNRFAKHMTSTSRVLSMDLPGFGEATRLDAGEYTYEKQVNRVHAFVEAVGLDEFHLGGYDMGGAIAAMYAAKHPEKLESLLLVAPMGVETPTMSEYGEALLKDQNPLEFKSVSIEETDKFLDYVFTSAPDDIPGIMKRAIAKRAMANADFNKKVAEMLLRGDLNAAVPSLEKITARSLVIWCNQDRVIHSSGAKVVGDKLKNSKVIVLENCGHVPHTERATESSQAYYEFVEQTG